MRGHLPPFPPSLFHFCFFSALFSLPSAENVGKEERTVGWGQRYLFLGCQLGAWLVVALTSDSM